MRKAVSAKAKRAAALEAFKQELERVGFFEKRKRSDELSANGRFLDGWVDAYRELQNCRRDELIFNAYIAGASKKALGDVVGLKGVEHVINKVAAGRYFRAHPRKS